MKKIISVLVVIAILLTSFPMHALEMSQLYNMEDEKAFREAIRGDELWAKNYPNGLFNFVGTQYAVQESQKFFEIAIVRQGGTIGDTSVDFKAIDISAEYGKDYVIRVYENSKRAEMARNKNAIPLMDLVQDDRQINISKSEQYNTSCNSTVTESVYSGENIKDENYINPTDHSDKPLTVQESVYVNEEEYIELDSKEVDFGTPKKANSLAELREAYLGIESGRPDWKDVDRESIEQLKAKYDEFFYRIPGAETTIEFKDGEYIKYLYIIPINDSISESEEQILFALTNPKGGAARGEFYMAYANLADDEEFEASTFQLESQSVIAQGNQASVVVRRTGGISQYASVYVGTEEGTAIADKDYVPGLKELFFTPGMTEQMVTVDILSNPNRENYREFTIALDRTNKSVDTNKASASIIIPTDTKAHQEKMQSTATNIVTQQTRTYTKGVEKISQYGFSPREGQWAVVGKDFTSGWTKGNVSTGDDWLYLRANGGESYAMANNVKLYGVDSVYFDGENTGCGHHWTEGWWIFSSDEEEHEFNTKFQIKNTSGQISTLWEKKGNVGYQGSKELSVPKSLWDTERLGFYTWAKSKNQSTANIDWLRLTLHEYELKMEDAPEFQVSKYDIEEGKLKKDETAAIGQPGYLTIKKNIFQCRKRRFIYGKNRYLQGVPFR